MSPRRAKKASRSVTRRPAKKKSPARKKPATQKRSPKKRAAGKVARSAAKRAAAKRPKRPAAQRSGVKKSTVKRPAAKKPLPGRPAALRLVTRPAAKPARVAARKPRTPRHKPFGGAIAGASAKDLALFDLVRARVEVQAAIQGMVAASAETPIAQGKWNPRQIVLHLHYWDREMSPYIEKAYLHGERPPHTMDRILEENAAAQEKLAGHDWEVARRLMQQSREAFLEALQSLPEEPAEMWSGEHALGWLIRLLSHHDRHHAAAIKEARIRTGEPR